MSATLFSVSRTLPPGSIREPIEVVTDGHIANERFFWSRPDEGWSFIALGVAADCQARGPDRISELAAFRARMADVIEVAEGALTPRLVGGASFDIRSDADHQQGDPQATLPGGPGWDAFGEGRLIVPALLVERRGDECTITAVAPSRSEADDLIEVHLAAERHRLSLEPAALSSYRSACCADVDAGVNGHRVDLGDDCGYVDLVERGIKTITNDELDKVVLARDVRVDVPDDLAGSLRNLTQRFPSCAIFAFAVGETTFFGATPERLVSFAEGEITTMALAGSIGRGSSHDADERLAARMLADPKERTEHRFVVDAIRERLESMGVEVDEPGEPAIARLAQVQHLSTELTGRFARGVSGDVVELAAALHPTPAVGGSPKELAVDWIRRNEPLDRGWYAGPIGWCDLGGGGDIRVALRSALVSPEGCRVFAGAGIVAASDAEHELAETALKLGAVVDSLDVEDPAAPDSTGSR